MECADGILSSSTSRLRYILKSWLPKENRDKILTGWNWILLRDEIINASTSNIKFPLVITTGGSDPSGVFFKIWNLLKRNKYVPFLDWKLICQ